VRDEIAYLDQGLGGTRPAIRFVDAAGKQLRTQSAEWPSLNNGLLRFLPDGERLAAYARPGTAATSAAYVVELGAKTEIRKLAPFPPGAYARGISFDPDGTKVVIGLRESASEVLLFR
jgi:hypothetical protein